MVPLPDAPPDPAPRLLALGDGAWTVEFGDAIDPALNARVMALADAVRRAGDDAALAGVVDVVPTFRSLTVHFDPLAADADALGARLLALAHDAAGTVHRGRRWRLPVCFDAEFAPDLPALAQQRGLAVDEVLQRLTAATFRVYMIGFMPGFPYLGGLPPELATPRLAVPRKRVPARSMAVAGTMCCVYPWDSPGGWNLLGRTPLPLFDAAHGDEPAWLAAGDELCWTAVDRATHDRLRADADAGRLRRADFLADDGAHACPA